MGGFILHQSHIPHTAHKIHIEKYYKFSQRPPCIKLLHKNDEGNLCPGCGLNNYGIGFRISAETRGHVCGPYGFPREQSSLSRQ